MQSYDGFFKQMQNPLGFRHISVVQGREGRPTNSPQVRIEKKEIGFVLVLFALLFEFGRPQDFLPPLKVIPFPSVIDASIALAVLFSGRVSLTNLQSKLGMALLPFMACW